MPPKRIRANLRSSDPDLTEVVRLADDFNVSKAAMARSYIDAHRATLALVVLRDGRLDQVYRPTGFPWIEPSIGDPVPSNSIACEHGLEPGQVSSLEECNPETWVGPNAVRRVDVLSEQLLSQREGYTMVLLFAETKA